jgi:hypothetical protein
VYEVMSQMGSLTCVTPALPGKDLLDIDFGR